MDCIWPAEFAAAQFILDVTDRISEEMRQDIWPGALEAVTYQGRMYGMPWLNDVLYLYYNEEMLKEAGFENPPKTWEELNEMAMAAKEQGLVEYPFIEYFQQEEGLTIAYAYYLFAFGGTFFNEDNSPAFNSPEGLAALQFMVDGMNNGLYNPASFESTYEEVRRTFSQGSSLFAVNWAYQLNLVAIMADSEHPEEAWNYIQYLSSQDVQKRYSQNALPIWTSLFSDPELQEMQPDVAKEQNFIEVSQEQYKYIRNRPIVPFYSETSEIVAREVQAALSGNKTPEQALADAEQAVLDARALYE
jgi:multiple sugar transport system substrate-binding protein